MNFDLLDFQRHAAKEVLSRLARARFDHANHGVNSAFPLSATTGAGKTVIATAVIEAMLFGSAEFGVDADERATFLWVTDDPSLNRQTRNKMQVASDLISPVHLETLNESYFEPTLRPGRVYFLNIQQLSKNAQFANTAGDSMRTKTGWEIIGDTITSNDVDLYVIVDEAHRGMRAATDRASIVRQIIDGRPGITPPAPSVWGISATVDRFNEAMKGIADRTTYEPVDVSLEDVRDSGLVKNRIELAEPGETGTFTMTLLRSATQQAVIATERWAKYAADEPNEPLVEPALVVQVADSSTDEHLAEIVATIEDEWPTLGPHAIVNVFGEHTDRLIPGRTLRYIAPEKVEDDPHARVVLAKTAISTGWDCPRAEVLYSERAAEDATHIAQVVGRMVRQPLARRITTDEYLNSVWCYLPEFKLSAVAQIVGELNDPAGGGGVADVIGRAADYPRDAELADVFDLLESIPCLPKPDVLANPLRRAKALAKALTDTSNGSAIVPTANADLTSRLNQRIKGLLVEHETTVAAKVADLTTAQTRITSIDVGTQTTSKPAVITVDTAVQDLINDTRRTVATLREGVGKDFLRHQAATRGDDLDGARTELAALIAVDGVVDAIEQTAQEWVGIQLDTHRVVIKNTGGALRAQFLRIQGQASEPEATTIEMPDVARTSTHLTADADAPLLPTFTRHIFADPEHHRYPVKLNGWETTVLETELARKSTVAWYRNPSHGSAAAHRIAYRTTGGRWASLQPDFIVVSRNPAGDLEASIVDPHGDHLADARSKLRALAEFAQAHGDRYLRIDSITETDLGLRVLDLQRQDVRDAVNSYTDAQVTDLYNSNISNSYT